MKLLVIQGIPGSGKTTLARKMVKEDISEKTVRVNRDDIRDMLGDYWVPSREKFVTNIEEYCIRTGLAKGYTVIVDATNLNPSVIRRFKALAKSLEVPIEFMPLQISVRDATIRVIKRKLKGGKWIPYKVIKGMHDKYNHTLKDEISN